MLPRRISAMTPLCCIASVPPLLHPWLPCRAPIRHPAILSPPWQRWRDAARTPLLRASEGRDGGCGMLLTRSPVAPRRAAVSRGGAAPTRVRGCWVPGDDWAAGFATGLLRSLVFDPPALPRLPPAQHPCAPSARRRRRLQGGEGDAEDKVLKECLIAAALLARAGAAVRGPEEEGALRAAYPVLIGRLGAVRRRGRLGRWGWRPSPPHPIAPRRGRCAAHGACLLACPVCFVASAHYRAPRRTAHCAAISHSQHSAPPHPAPHRPPPRSPVPPPCPPLSCAGRSRAGTRTTPARAASSTCRRAALSPSSLSSPSPPLPLPLPLLLYPLSSLYLCIYLQAARLRVE